MAAKFCCREAVLMGARDGDSLRSAPQLTHLSSGVFQFQLSDQARQEYAIQSSGNLLNWNSMLEARQPPATMREKY